MDTRRTSTRIGSCLFAAALALPAAALADSWSQQAPPTPPSTRSHPGAAQIAADEVLIFGGSPGVLPSVLGDTWIYDLSADTWTEMSPADDADGNPEERSSHGIAPIGTEQALLYGGLVPDGVGVALDGGTWLYDRGTNTWTLKALSGPTPGARHNVELARVGPNQVLLFGGTNVTIALGDSWVYNVTTDEWTEKHPELNGDLPAPRYLHALASIGDDKVLLFGGISCTPDPSCASGTHYADPSTWLYDLSDDQWTELSPAGGVTPEPGNEFALVWLGGDRVLLFGGWSEATSDLLGGTWIFDLSENSWTEQAPPTSPTQRESMGAGSLDGEKALIFGGKACDTPACADENRVDETWVYEADPDSTPTLSGMKYYDANANGQFDGGEVGIEGWPIDVTGSLGTTTVATLADGTFELELDPDTYSVAEQLSANLAWHQTGNTVDQSNTTGVTLEADGSYTVEVVDGDYPGLYFGNLCLGAGGAPPGGAYGLGFWTNKNAAKIVGAGDLAMLVALHLKGQNGADFDPATFTLLKNWLAKAKSTNMAYMLSAQMAALALSVHNGFVDDALLVYAPGATGSNAAGFATVADLIAEADAALAADSQTPAGDPNRAYQEGLKDALEGANKNLTFVQASPADCPAPF